MREVPNWDRYFMGLAWKATERSKDPSTNVGCVLVKDKHVISTGYNGMPQNCDDTVEHWTRPLKYDLVIHAEMNAVGIAAKRGAATNGATAYVTHFPCLGCAKTLVSAGIDTIFYDKKVVGWDEENTKAVNLFWKSGVKVIELGYDA